VTREKQCSSNTQTAEEHTITNRVTSLSFRWHSCENKATTTRKTIRALHKDYRPIHNGQIAYIFSVTQQPKGSPHCWGF